MSVWPHCTAGAKGRHALVMLHGFMGCGEDWLGIVSRLSVPGFCVLPDLPGHGSNLALPLHEPLSFEGLADGLVRLLDELGLPRAHVVGYSMGGRIALYAATRHPERVAALTIESAHPGLVDSAARRERAALDDRRAATLLEAGISPFVDHWYEAALFRSLHDHPPLLAETRRRRKRNHPAWMAKVVRELSPGRMPPLWDALERLEMPVLLVAGARDAKYAAIIRQMGAAIPNARVEIVPAAGHNVHLEQPEAFSAVLEDFITRVARREREHPDF